MMIALTLALLLQADFEKDLDSVVSRLASDDVQVREAAREDLMKLVQSDKAAARKHLKPRIEKAEDPEVKVWLSRALAALTTIDDVKMEIVFAKPDVSLEEVNSRQFRFKVRLTNGSDTDVALYRNWAIGIQDEKGAAATHNELLGRWGVRPSGCFLAIRDHFFIRVPAGKSVDIEEGIASYTGDADLMQGFELPAPGSFTLKLTYSYARQAFKGQCGDGCAGHDDPDKPWNTALEGTKSFEARLVVRGETEEEKARREARLKRLDEIAAKVKKGEMSKEEFERILKEELTPEEGQLLLKKILGLQEE